MARDPRSRAEALGARRPAETLGAAAGLAIVVGRALGIEDPDVLAGLAAAAGGLPALVTALVNAGGLLGIARRLLHGRGA